MARQIFFFQRRLQTLLGLATVTNYDEDIGQRQVQWTVVGTKSLTAKTVRQLRQLLGTRLVTLTADGNSLKVIAREVLFPMEN